MGLGFGGWLGGALSRATRDQFEKETSCLGSMRDGSGKTESSELFDLGDDLLQSGRQFKSSSGNSVLLRTVTFIHSISCSVIPDGQDCHKHIMERGLSNCHKNYFLSDHHMARQLSGPARKPYRLGERQCERLYLLGVSLLCPRFASRPG